MYGFVLGVFFLITLTSVLKWGVSTEGFCPRGGFRPGGFVLGGVLSYTLTSVFKLGRVLTGGGFDRGGFCPTFVRSTPRTYLWGRHMSSSLPVEVKSFP